MWQRLAQLKLSRGGSELFQEATEVEHVEHLIGWAEMGCHRCGMSEGYGMRGQKYEGEGSWEREVGNMTVMGLISGLMPHLQMENLSLRKPRSLVV